ncbi:MAG: ATP-binding protein [Tannerella sp.]|jgi:hypothetical protein|nr:ATP-binding protein [Tannerella sp.]
MEKVTRKLPLSIQDFEDLRNKDFLYVDKTSYVKRLATYGKQYFLGRPRRFGKSLFISTLKAYFLGKKHLFDGLYIGEIEKEWIEYPVFHLDFVGEQYTSEYYFNAKLDAILRVFESQWGKDEADTTFPARFSGLIRRAYEKTGKQVVVLVDEYDKPLLESMHNKDLHEIVISTLKSFYGVLKSMDICLRFVFITGITKFSKVSIFSDLNHLTDISLSDEYAGICGLTETELKDNFQPELKALAKNLDISEENAFAQLKKNYDGYHFSRRSDHIYNPYSVLNTFYSNYFEYYWFETGTPTFLVQMIRSFRLDPRKFSTNDVAVPIDFLSDYRVNGTDPVPVLYQSGYLTIKRFDSKYNSYFLGYPNEEVRYGFMKNMLGVYSPADVQIMNSFFAGDFVRKLEVGDIESFMSMVKSFYKSIQYDAIDNEKKDEKYYQLIFYLLFTLMGQFTQIEVKDANGRADAVVKTADSIFVFEFKMDNKATAEDALNQIDTKEYLIPYTTDGRKLFKIGAEFSVEKRGLTRWVINN